MKKIARNVAQPIFGQHCHMTFAEEESRTKNLYGFLKFRKTAQRKQSPNRRKIAQSGHTVAINHSVQFVSNVLIC
jgi:hypothetical protein